MRSIITLVAILGLLALSVAVARASCNLEDEVKLEDAIKHLKELNRIANENNGNRAAGTFGYAASLVYVHDQLHKHAKESYNKTIQDFQIDSFVLRSTPTMVQTSPVSLAFKWVEEFYVFEGSASAVLTNVSASSVPGLGCNASDYAAFPRGNVAIVMRGECTFVEKIALATSAGASAIVIYNHKDGGVVFSGRASNASIPIFSTSYFAGLALADETNVRLSLSVNVSRIQTTTQNLIVDGNKGDAKRILVMGSHLDSVAEGPGVNDNGSGSAVSLTIAIAAAKCLDPKLRLRFAWWGAEELGLLGSSFYVDNLKTTDPSALGDIALNINVDMIASPNFFYGIYAGSTAPPPIRNQSAIIEAEYQKALNRLGCNHQPTGFDGRSDYGPFIQNGIPAGGVFTGAETVKSPAERALYGGIANAAFDPCYHQSCDTIDNVSPLALSNMLKSTAAVLQKLATDSSVISKLQRAEPFSPKPLDYATSPKAISIM